MFKKLYEIYFLPEKKEVSGDKYEYYVLRKFIFRLLFYYILCSILILCYSEPKLLSILLLAFMIPFTSNTGLYEREGTILIRNKYFYISILLSIFIFIILEKLI